MSDFEAFCLKIAERSPWWSYHEAKAEEQGLIDPRSHAERILVSAVRNSAFRIMRKEGLHWRQIGVGRLSLPGEPPAGG